MIRRILVIGMSGDKGGIENYLLNLYENLDKSKIQFDFLVKDEIGESYTKRIRKQGGNIYIIGTFRKNIVGVMNRLIKLYKSRQYSRIYVNLSYAPTMIYVLPALFYRGVKVYVHSHASDDFRKKRHLIFRKLFFELFPNKRNYVYIGCSESACLWMFGDKCVKKHKMHVIKNGVCFEKFIYSESKKKAVRAKLELNDNFVVGHVGRFSEEKNHHFILDAFRELLRLKPEARLLLIGEGHLMDDIKSLSEQYGLNNKVIFLGGVSDTSDYYNAMDCFWLPSLYEGFPIVAVEAQINGLKCIFSEQINREVDIVEENVFASISNVSEFVAITSNIEESYQRDLEGKQDKLKKFDLEESVNQVQALLLK